MSKVCVLITSVCFLISAARVSAASFVLSPASQQSTVGCEQSLQLTIDATNEDSNAADVEIAYDPAILQITDSNNELDGVQVETGNAYLNYWGNIVDTDAGIIRLTAGSIGSTLHSDAIFATIHYIAKTAATTEFNIKFDGAGQTLDSNIADTSTSTDLLTAVTNATVVAAAGVCQSQVLGISDVKPAAVILNPVLNQQPEDLTPHTPPQLTTLTPVGALVYLEWLNTDPRTVTTIISQYPCADLSCTPVIQEAESNFAYISPATAGSVIYVTLQSVYTDGSVSAPTSSMRLDLSREEPASAGEQSGIAIASTAGLGMLGLILISRVYLAR